MAPLNRRTLLRLAGRCALAAPVAVDLFAGIAGERLEDRIVAALGSGEVSMPLLAKTLGIRMVDLDGTVKRLARAGRLRVTQRILGVGAMGPPRIKVVRLLESATTTSTPSSVATGTTGAADAAREEPSGSVAQASSTAQRPPVGEAARADGVIEALRRAPVQARCVELLREAGGVMPLRDLAASVAGSRAAVKRLVERRFARVTVEAWEGKDTDSYVRVPELDLNPAQAAASAGSPWRFWRRAAQR